MMEEQVAGVPALIVPSTFGVLMLRPSTEDDIIC